MSPISQYIDGIPFNRFQTKLLVAGGAGNLFDALDVAIIGFVLPIIAAEWALSGGQLGLIAAGGSIGGVFGAYLAGYCGDRWGRRTVMMYALSIYSISTLVSAAATGWLSLLFPRIIAGIGTSAESVIIAPYLSEFVASRFRGRFVGAITSFFSFGFLAAALLGYFLIPQFASGWRIALVICASPVLMLLWWRRSLPESPVWLEGKGRIDEARAICETMATSPPIRGAALARAPVRAPSLGAQEAEPDARPRLALLFQPEVRGRTLAACVVWAVMGMCYYAFVSWIPSLLVARGFGITRSFAFTVAIFGAQIPGYFSAALLNDAIGARRVIILYLSIGATAALALTAAGSEVEIIAASVVLSFAMNGTYSGLYAYTPDLFPTAVRATGQGLAIGLSRIGALISPILVGFAYPAVGFLGVFGAATVLLAIAIACLVTAGRPRPSFLLQPTSSGREFPAGQSNH